MFNLAIKCRSSSVLLLLSFGQFACKWKDNTKPDGGWGKCHEYLWGHVIIE